jgi:hypothetical protein
MVGCLQRMCFRRQCSHATGRLGRWPEFRLPWLPDPSNMVRRAAFGHSCWKIVAQGNLRATSGPRRRGLKSDGERRGEEEKVRELQSQRQFLDGPASPDLGSSLANSPYFGKTSLVQCGLLPNARSGSFWGVISMSEVRPNVFRCAG